MNFSKWLFYIIEGQLQDQTLKMVNGDQNIFQQIQSISPEPKFMPIIAYFHIYEKIALSQIRTEIGRYIEYVKNKKIPMVQITKRGAFLENKPINWIGLTEKIHAIEERENFINRDANKDVNDGVPVKGKPIFSKNNIDVYEAHGRDKCIQYGTGYSFCISKPGNTMWQSYRDIQASTFYFVFDRNRSKQDPLHVVVVDSTENGWSLTDSNNDTGNIAQFGSDSEAYISHLVSKGIPKEIFKHIEHDEQEKLDKEKLGEHIEDLEYFVKELSYEEKSKYIGRGHDLTDSQFKYLIDNNFDDLINQYITNGEPLNKKELVLLKNKLLKSYFRTRIKTATKTGFYKISKDELEYFDKKMFLSNLQIFNLNHLMDVFAGTYPNLILTDSDIADTANKIYEIASKNPFNAKNMNYFFEDPRVIKALVRTGEDDVLFVGDRFIRGAMFTGISKFMTRAALGKINDIDPDIVEKFVVKLYKKYLPNKKKFLMEDFEDYFKLIGKEHLLDTL